MENSDCILEGRQVLEINEIMSILPHRYPFLLIDRIIEIERKKRIVALKNVTVNEPYFNGHFPGNPVMPGVLQLEAMAQTAAVITINSSARSATGYQPFFDDQVYPRQGRLVPRPPEVFASAAGSIAAERTSTPAICSNHCEHFKLNLKTKKN